MVDVAVTRIEDTTVEASLAGYDLDGEERDCDAVLRHRDGHQRRRHRPRRPPAAALRRSTATGRLVAPTGIDAGLRRAPARSCPAVFAPGDEATLVPDLPGPRGRHLESVMFRPPEGVVPLQWRARSRRTRAAGEKARAKEGERDRPTRS